MNLCVLEWLVFEKQVGGVLSHCDVWRHLESVRVAVCDMTNVIILSRGMR